MKLRPLIICCMLFAPQSCVSPQRMADGVEGISDQLGMTDSHGAQRSSNWVLARDSRLYVARPQADLFDEPLQDQIVASLRNFCPAAAKGDSRENYAEALISASQLNSDYLVYPQLVSRTEKTGLWRVIMTTLPYSEKQRGEIRLRLTLYAVDSGKIVDQALLGGRGGVLTQALRSEQLLAAPLDEYVKGIFR